MARSRLIPRARSTDARGTTRSRMLVALALAGSVALLTGCGVESDPGAPPAPSTIPGAEPVPLDDAVLAATGLLEGMSGSAIEVRWATPGESIAVIVGGSGTGGDCIVQPHTAELDPNLPEIIVGYDAPNPDAACDGDYRLHGWELALAESIDASRLVPVQLVDEESGGIAHLELGPDDLLVSETADPQPSEVPDSGETPAPEPIPAEQLPDPATVTAAAQQVQVQWVDRGASIAVLLAGSGTEACVPQPIGAKSTGPGSIEVSFEPATGTTCTDDLVIHGWRITLPEAVSATLPIDVRVTGASDAGTSVDLTLEADDVLELQ